MEIEVSRVEALLFLYLVAMLAHALLERELPLGMARAAIDSLPLYPERRKCKAPSTERLLDLFAPLARHRLCKQGRAAQIFEPELTALHKKILRLLGLSPALFRSRP